MTPLNAAYVQYLVGWAVILAGYGLIFLFGVFQMGPRMRRKANGLRTVAGWRARRRPKRP